MSTHTSKYCTLCRDPADAGELMQECYFCDAKFHLCCINLSKIVPLEDQYKCELCIADENGKTPHKERTIKETEELKTLLLKNEVWSKRLYHEKLLFIDENVEDLRHFCTEKTMNNLLNKELRKTSSKEIKEISKEEYDSLYTLTETPDYIRGAFKNYQMEGIAMMSSWFCRGVGGILADEMGLGKTFQTIGFLARLKHIFKLSGPHLVVVPLAVIQNWANEIMKFCPTLTFKKVHGSMAERKHIFEDPDVLNCKFDVYLTTYDTLVSDEPFFTESWSWITITIDEGHRIKNENARLRMTLSRLRSDFRLLLTGTPLQNNLHELWALLDYILPEIFGGQSAIFDNAFQNDKDVVNTDICRRARKLLDVHMMIRRLKSEVEIALLPKILVKIPVPITPFQKKFYDSIVQLDLSEASIINVKQLNHRLALLRKVVNHPKQIYLRLEDDRRAERSRVAAAHYAGSEFAKQDWRLIEPEFGSSQWAAEEEMRSLTGERLVKSCGKLMMLDMLLMKLKNRKSRCLVFSQFTETLDILEEYVNYRFGKINEVYFRLDGQTNRVIRELNNRAFNHPDAKSFIYLISTTAGGIGINLATADSVILYDSSWNPQIDLQAQDRAHRIGQKKQVTIYRLIAENTFEERVLQIAERKQILDELVISKRGGGIESDIDTSESEMTITELKNVLNYGMQKMSLSSKFQSKMGVDSFAEMLDKRLNSCIANPVDMSGQIIKRANSGQEGDESVTNVTCPLCMKSFSLNGYTIHVSQGLCERELPSDSKEASGDGQVQMAIDIADLDKGNRDKESETIGSNDSMDVKEAKPKGPFDDLFMQVVKRQADMNFFHEDNASMPLAGFTVDPGVSEEGVETSGETKRTRKAVVKYIPNEFYDHKVKEKKMPRVHEDICFTCNTKMGPGSDKKENDEHPSLMKCKHCPKVYHCDCVKMPESQYIMCPWHNCIKCKRSSSDSGGMQFRCMDCPTSYCFDCWPVDKEMENFEPPKRFVDNFTKRGFAISKNVLWFRCPVCEEKKGKFIKYVEQKSIDRAPVITAKSAPEEKSNKKPTLWCNTLTKSDMLNLLFAEKLVKSDLSFAIRQGLHRYTDPLVFSLIKQLVFSLGDHGSKKFSSMLIQRGTHGTCSLYLQGKEGNKRSKLLELTFLESVNEFCELDSYIDEDNNPNVAAILELIQSIHQRKQSMDSILDDQLNSTDAFCGLVPKKDLMELLFSGKIQPVNLSIHLSFGNHFFTDPAVYSVIQALVQEMHKRGLMQQQVVAKISALVKLGPLTLSKYLYGKLEIADTKQVEFKIMDFLFEYCFAEIKARFNLSDTNSNEEIKKCNNSMLMLFRTVISNAGAVPQSNSQPDAVEVSSSSSSGNGSSDPAAENSSNNQTYNPPEIPGYALIKITIPRGVYPGDHFKFVHEGSEYAIKAPDGCFAGHVTQAYIPYKKPVVGSEYMKNVYQNLNQHSQKPQSHNQPSEKSNSASDSNPVAKSQSKKYYRDFPQSSSSSSATDTHRSLSPKLAPISNFDQHSIKDSKASFMVDSATSEDKGTSISNDSDKRWTLQRLQESIIKLKNDEKKSQEKIIYYHNMNTYQGDANLRLQLLNEQYRHKAIEQEIKQQESLFQSMQSEIAPLSQHQAHQHSAILQQHQREILQLQQEHTILQQHQQQNFLNQQQQLRSHYQQKQVQELMLMQPGLSGIGLNLLLQQQQLQGGDFQLQLALQQMQKEHRQQQQQLLLRQQQEQQQLRAHQQKQLNQFEVTMNSGNHKDDDEPKSEMHRQKFGKDRHNPQKIHIPQQQQQQPLKQQQRPSLWHSQANTPSVNTKVSASASSGSKIAFENEISSKLSSSSTDSTAKALSSSSSSSAPANSAISTAISTAQSSTVAINNPEIGQPVSICVLLHIPSSFNAGKVFVFASQGVRYKIACPEGSPGNSIKLWIPKSLHNRAKLDESKDSKSVNFLELSTMTFKIISNKNNGSSNGGDNKATIDSADKDAHQEVTLDTKKEVKIEEPAKPESKPIKIPINDPISVNPSELTEIQRPSISSSGSTDSKGKRSLGDPMKRTCMICGHEFKSAAMLKYHQDHVACGRKQMKRAHASVSQAAKKHKSSHREAFEGEDTSDETVDTLDETSCFFCNKKVNEDQVLLCDGLNCNKEWHMYCLSPPLDTVPEGQWFCPSCVESGNLVAKEE